MSNEPRSPFPAVRRRRFLLSAWPWRSYAHVLTTVPVGLALLIPVGVLAVPWFLLFAMWADETAALGPVLTAVLLLLGAALVGGLGPMATLPAASLERLRLRLVDSDRVASGHRTPDRPGLWAWLRLRYTEAATWREFGYVLVLSLGMLPLALLLLACCGGLALLAASPVIVAAGQGPVTMGTAVLERPVEAVPYGLLGLALTVLTAYPAALLAGAHRALGRALLRGRGEEELRAELVRVTRSRARLVNAFEAERRRIERDLHDGAQQRLVALTMQLGLARLDVPADSPAAASVAAAHDQAKQLIAELRELVRGIHPQILTDRGLAAALPELADRSALPVRVATDLPRRPPAHVEGTAYFVVSEALTNVAKHSGAAGASVTAGLAGDTLVVEVRDDGRGGADPGRGTGLTGLADRVAVMDGRMSLSSPPGGPTVLRVELPCDRIPPHPPTRPRPPSG
ncbi:sensor histidine kinase [Actinorugispora endophytica]|uniref:histidine kinase n=1 Tax=Actinorugispora endophytica TaxID=1605990 RepID=A0A4R6V1B1_9ACTN|nr:sensor histidine kinase [Actinorugispora endophytica]TDQ53825.1 signal transduction histidine kinase [Actinorugispora endophytica]